MPFHLRLPKPLHGWREFVGEVGIIVVGVLIALTAEQVVETIHWRSQVDEARTALGIEISDSLGQAIEREKLSRCVNRRLDEISVILSQASRSGGYPLSAISAAHRSARGSTIAGKVPWQGRPHRISIGTNSASSA